MVEPVYAARRTDLLIVAVNCSHPAATCFCTSMDTGPRVRRGFDLALTELDADRYLVEIGTPKGAGYLQGIPAQPTGDGRRPTRRPQAASDRRQAPCSGACRWRV